MELQELKIREQAGFNGKLRCLHMGKLQLWISYDTVIGFSEGMIIVISENTAGSTTGKHLNYLAHKSNRVSRDEFLGRLNSILAKRRLFVKR